MGIEMRQVGNASPKKKLINGDYVFFLIYNLFLYLGFGISIFVYVIKYKNR